MPNGFITFLGLLDNNEFNIVNREGCVWSLCCYMVTHVGATWFCKPFFSRCLYFKQFYKEVSQWIMGNVRKVKLSLSTHEGIQGKWSFSCTLFWPQHLIKVSGKFYILATLPPRKSPCIHWVGWFPEPIWTILEKVKSCASAGIWTPVHPAHS